MDAQMECSALCQYREKIETVYEVVITGNGEGPVKGRVKQLEVEMATTILPILNDLKKAADQQDGRDAERLIAEGLRDKAWKNFRWCVVTLISVVSILVIAYVGLKSGGH
jgi:hypothetical protein